MMNSIDIDVGGTFTDLVLNFEGKRSIAKSPTTPHDLSLCFTNVIMEGADDLDLELEELLPKIDIIRYSTTVAMNRLIQRQGPRLGIITTEGHEDASLIGRGAQWVDGTRVAERRNLAIQNKPEPLVSRNRIVGVKERIDSNGNIVRPLDEEDVRHKISLLMDQGVRTIVVSLLWSFLNPEHENRIKEIIREEYKEYHIGYLPVILSSQVVAKSGEYARTMTAVLDAYLQQTLQVELSATWDRLRAHGYAGTFLMIHNSGGCAEIFKTTASRTFNGGPVAGIMGSYYLAKQLNYKNVIASDMGGTSFDIGIIVESSVRNYDFQPILDHWMVSITMLQSLSIGAGGGSIAWVNNLLGKRLEVGPKSAGSMPGPACYDMGGSEPTVTDADVVLGYIDPKSYFGGRMSLNKARAEQAIEEKIAKPMGITVVEAAALIRELVDAQMESAIKREIHMRGYDPEDFVLFAFGGAGPTHVSGYLGDISSAIVFESSPVFCAMGQSLMDIAHVYEKSLRMLFMEPLTEQFTNDYDTFNKTVQELIDAARSDLIGEGLDPDKAVYSLELDMLYGGQIHVKRASSPKMELHTPADLHAIYDSFEREFSETFSPLVVNKPGGVFLDNFILKATMITEKPDLQEYPLMSGESKSANTGSRSVYWPQLGNYVETDIFHFNLLKPGNLITGPAIIESDLTTIVVTPDLQFYVDNHGFGVIEKLAVTQADRLAVG